MSRQVLLRRIFSVSLLVVWCVVVGSICAAAPLMVEKNLFANDRKPPPPDSADTSVKSAKQGMGIGNFQLDGVIIGSNTKRAVLRMKNPGPGAQKGQPASPFVTVREGQTVSDYRVTKIEPKSISLEKDGQTFTLGLFADNKVSTPASPTPAPVQPPPPPPGAAPQQGAAQAPGIQSQAGENQQNAQPLPGQPPNRRGLINNRNMQPPNANAPVPDPAINQDPNPPAETVEEEQ